MSLQELSLEAENNPHIKLSKRKQQAIQASNKRPHSGESEDHHGGHLSRSAHDDGKVDSHDESPPDSPAFPGHEVWHGHGGSNTNDAGSGSTIGECDADGDDTACTAAKSVTNADNALAKMGKTAPKAGDPSSMLPLLSNGMRPGWSKFQGDDLRPSKSTNCADGGATGILNSSVEGHHFLDISTPNGFHLQLGSSHADSHHDQWADSQRRISLRASQTAHEDGKIKHAGSLRGGPFTLSPKESGKKSAWDSALKGSGKTNGEAAVGLRAEVAASKMVVRERRALDIRSSIKRVDEHGNETLNKVSCHHGQVVHEHKFEGLSFLIFITIL